jgi:hypothetical protein
VNQLPVDPTIAPTAMSRIDYFACAALAGALVSIVEGRPPTSDDDQQTLAYHCFRMARAMDRASAGAPLPGTEEAGDV